MTLADEDALEPLGVTCTSTDCDNDKHCFLQKSRKPKGALRPGGPCRDCGADLIDWDRVNKRNVLDAAHTFDALRQELIRHVFWHTSFNQKERNHAARKGKTRLREAAIQRIKSSVGGAKNAREGRQTPFTGTVIYHAQHAVAACCRKCIEYWHAIPPGRDLTNDEIAYLGNLVMLYLDERLPGLAADPTKVPPIRRKRTATKKTTPKQAVAKRATTRPTTRKTAVEKVAAKRATATGARTKKRAPR